MSWFKNALLFGDQNFPSGDHFTKGSRQKATSEKLELGALCLSNDQMYMLWFKIFQTRLICVFHFLQFIIII